MGFMKVRCVFLVPCSSQSALSHRVHAFMCVMLYRVELILIAGIAIGGDCFPGSTLSDHVLRFNNIPQVCELSMYHKIPLVNDGTLRVSEQGVWHSFGLWSKC